MRPVGSRERAAAEIAALGLPTAGLLNNAGIVQTRPTKSAQGWDMTFATNYLGPIALTEALVPHLAGGAHVVFVASAVENPEHGPAQAVCFRGGRFISVEAGARGEREPGSSKQPGTDAYATSKPCVLAAMLAFARETPLSVRVLGSHEMFCLPAGQATTADLRRRRSRWVRLGQPRPARP